MNKQKGYYDTNVALIVIIGLCIGLSFPYTIPFIWTSVVKPLLLALV